MHLPDPRTYGVATLVGLGLLGIAVNVARWLEWKARPR